MGGKRRDRRRTSSRSSRSDTSSHDESQTTDDTGRAFGRPTLDESLSEAAAYFGREIADRDEYRTLLRYEDRYGNQVREWIDEGMPLDVMGRPSRMERFRERKGTPVPWDVERFVDRSRRYNTDERLRRVRSGGSEDRRAPESLQCVVPSPGRSLGDTVRRGFGDEADEVVERFGAVRIHADAAAAEAAADLDARAFVVGSHVGFARGEFDPSSTAGRRLLAHQLAHAHGNTPGTVSVLPRDGEIETRFGSGGDWTERVETLAERVSNTESVAVRRFSGAPIHVQRRKSAETLRDELDAEREARVERIVERVDEVESVEALLSQLTGQLAGLNHELERRQKIDERIGGGDICFVGYGGPSGQPHFLLQTDKWTEGIGLHGDGMPDLKHVAARHAHPDSEGQWPVEPGVESNDDEELFPHNWGRDEVLNVVRVIVEEGDVGINPGELVYRGPEIDPCSFDAIALVRNTDTGIVRTVYPKVPE
ncbi:DUF4157 domain-containing protein [Halobaculum sp. MBLA0147]|uniref:eCIS core domain-containing protein n=1 Tax=Halobaculum sp. MBLA0147 TaxID=3079934 RepID=UPI0035260602